MRRLPVVVFVLAALFAAIATVFPPVAIVSHYLDAGPGAAGHVAAHYSWADHGRGLIWTTPWRDHEELWFDPIPDGPLAGLRMRGGLIVAWPRLALEIALILAVGGLTGGALRLRARRAAVT